MMEHRVFTKEQSHVTSHPVVQKGDGNMESDTNSGMSSCLKSSNSSVQSFELVPVVMEKKNNPDHSEWDTDVM